MNFSLNYFFNLDEKEEQAETLSNSIVDSILSPELSTNVSLETVVKSTPKRRGRRPRRRSTNSIRKDQGMTRRSQRLNQSLDKQSTDLPIEQENSKKRKLTGDTNSEEHIVPKRKPCGRPRKHSNKSLTLSLELTSV